MKNGEKPIANAFVVLREEFDDWAILFDPDTGHAFGLNPNGVYLWKLFDGEHSIDTLLMALRRDAENVPQEAGEHLLAFIEELTAQGLAGYGGAHAQDDRGRITPSCACAGTTKVRYEPPKLVNLSGQQAARGNCTNGSSDTNYCASGPVYCVYSSCIGGACAPSSYCSAGGTTGSNCLDGTSAPYGACGCGGSGAKQGKTCYGGCNTTTCITTGSGA